MLLRLFAHPHGCLSIPKGTWQAAGCDTGDEGLRASTEAMMFVVGPGHVGLGWCVVARVAP
jgi:hypothetical protein